MLRNFLRNSLRNPLHIPGLVIGLAACILLLLVIRFESSFDNFHPNKDRIYRVVRVGKGDDPSYRPGVPFPVPDGIRTDYPQLDKVGLISQDGDVHIVIPARGNSPVKKFREQNVYCVDTNFFSIFDFPMLSGTPQSALAQPFSIVLTKTMAEKYFGNWHAALGQTLFLYGSNMTVKGILKDPPPNTDMPLGFVVSYPTLKQFVNMNNWVNISDSYYCFVLLHQGDDPKRLEAQLPAFMARHMPPDHSGYNLRLQPLSEMHYDERFGTISGVTFSKDLIKALALIGLFLLVVASVNFINLSTAQATNRAKEVGIRKVLGGTRGQLLLQFLTETALTCVLALVLALVVAYFSLPLLNGLMETKLHLSWDLLPYSAGILLAVVLCSGLYPAFLQSGFKPIQALKSRAVTQSTRGFSLRKALVVFQLVIAQGLIILTLVVVSQLNYVKNAYLGFHKDEILTVDFPPDSVHGSRRDVLRNELLAQPSIESVSFSTGPPAAGGNSYTDFQFATTHTHKPDLIINVKGADADYFKLYGFSLLAGRTYGPTDSIQNGFVVNETLLKQAGLGRPGVAIGKQIRVDGTLAPIIGVIGDYHMNSLRDPLDPVVISPLPGNYYMLNIRSRPGQARQTIAAIAAIWGRDFPDYAYEYNFLDQSIAEMYKQEDVVSTLYQVFAGIAIFISCLGLYGLISFMAIRRNKEIGIRKVLGATVAQMVYLLSREFTLLIVLAFLIAGPVAWYFSHDWLERYTFRINLGVAFFGIAFLASVLVAWLTVGYSAIRAAMANPVKSLRSE